MKDIGFAIAFLGIILLILGAVISLISVIFTSDPPMWPIKMIAAGFLAGLIGALIAAIGGDKSSGKDHKGIS